MGEQSMIACSAFRLAAGGPTPGNQELEDRLQEFDLKGNACVIQGEYSAAGGRSVHDT